MENTRIINHKILRQGTGIIALFLPFIVQLLSGSFDDLSSISASYWTDSGDIFVGSLIAVAFFLAAYNGTGSCNRDSEFYISKCAGFFALMVALIPTDCDPCNGAEVPDWVSLITFNNSSTVHNVAAILLFVCLFLLISNFARRAKYIGMITRSRFYSAIGLGMIIGMPLVFFIGYFTGWYEYIYWVELVGLLLFGAGWLSAGTYSPIPEEKYHVLHEFTEITVDPKNKNFPTGIEVKAGECYLFEASGCWKDSFLSCGPNGWGPIWNPLVLWNRIKGEPLFMLCGNVGKSWNDEHLTFVIGDKRKWTVPPEVDNLKQEDRKLYLFANDWKSKYHNNGGELTVTICQIDTKSSLGQNYPVDLQI